MDLRFDESYPFACWTCVFDRSKLVPCKNSRKRVCENLLRLYKTGMVLPTNFYRTRIKETVIITRIKSSSKLLVFLVGFFMLFCDDFTHLVLSNFLCCRTCNVLISFQIISACSMSSEIHHLQLKFAFFL